MKPLRLGMVNFINTSPLYIPWQEMGPLPSWEVVEGTPTELNRLLSHGKLDAGLVSSYAYGQNWRSYCLLPHLCISATGCVGSVLLFSKCPVEELNQKKIALTPQSATSINLLYIILEDFYGLRPQYSVGEFKNLEDGSFEAYLAIGDEALRLRESLRDLHVLDLAKVWLDRTRLPFVFAVWAARKDSFTENKEAFFNLCDRLVRCYLQGKRELDRISKEVAGRIPMSPEACLKYLDGIQLDFSRKKQAGLKDFFERLHIRKGLPDLPELNLIPCPDIPGLQEESR